MRLKKWVKILIFITTAIAMFMGAMDFDDTKTFIIVHLISMAIILVNTYIVINNQESF